MRRHDISIMLSNIPLLLAFHVQDFLRPSSGCGAIHEFIVRSHKSRLVTLPTETGTSSLSPMPYDKRETTEGNYNQRQTSL